MAVRDALLTCGDVVHGTAQGKLDQRRQESLLQFSIGRDISPAIFDDMLEKIKTWCAATKVL